MRLSIALLFTSALSALAAPAAEPDLGIQFEKRQAGELPLLKLPYGTWRAARYDQNSDFYTFKNIRFAAPPLGNLRWAKPAPPRTETTIQDGSYGPQCVQAQGNSVSLPSGRRSDGGVPLPEQNRSDNEDCLFLDLYVPGKAIRKEASGLTVVVWVYGGAYIFGSKDGLEEAGLYTGEGIIDQSDGNVIYVAGNYRLGAYGFLAGSTMERDGLPNTGFYDQRAVFQWVQSYIGLVGGDRTNVNAWGESAGGGSIEHQLIAFGGTQNPLFKKIFTQSPAFQQRHDRRGQLERDFQKFASLAGCAGKGVACLRAASEETLRYANQELQNQAPEGSYSVGPAADGSWVRQLASLEFASGNYFKGIESGLISHVRDEAELFVPDSVQTDEQFVNFVRTVLSGSETIVQAIVNYYPSPFSPGSPYTTQRQRVKTLIRDSSFNCNPRYLTTAYAGKTWNMQYSTTPGYHATDLVPLFYNQNVNVDQFFLDYSVPLVPGFGNLAQTYQSYATSHARTGDPNTLSYKTNLPPYNAINWPRPGSLQGERYTNVLNVAETGFSLITDNEDPKSPADFWLMVSSALTQEKGNSPRGATTVPQNIVTPPKDPSANYSTPK